MDGQTFAMCCVVDDVMMGTILPPALLHLGGCIKTLPPRQRGYFQHFIPHPKPHPSLHSEEIEEEKASRSL